MTATGTRKAEDQTDLIVSPKDPECSGPAIPGPIRNCEPVLADRPGKKLENGSDFMLPENELAHHIKNNIIGLSAFGEIFIDLSELRTIR